MVHKHVVIYALQRINTTPPSAIQRLSARPLARSHSRPPAPKSLTSDSRRIRIAFIRFAKPILYCSHKNCVWANVSLANIISVATYLLVYLQNLFNSLSACLPSIIIIVTMALSREKEKGRSLYTCRPFSATQRVIGATLSV